MAVNLSPLGGVGAQFFDSNGNPLSGGLIYTYAAGTSTPAATYTSSTGLIQHSNPIVLDAAGRVPTGEIWLTDGISYKFTIKTSADVLVGTYDNIVGINSNFIAYTSQQEIQTATAGQTVFTLTTMQYQPGVHNLSVFVDGVNQYGPGAQYAYVETDATTVTFVSGLHVGASVKFTTASPVSSSSTDAQNVSFTGVKGQQGAVSDLGTMDGSDWVGFQPDGTGAVSADYSIQDKLRQTISVKDFGAVGDGVTDDTVAIQAALDYCGTTLNTLLFPAGTYQVTSSLMWPYSASEYKGFVICGESSTVRAGSVADSTIINFTPTSGSLFDLTNGNFNGTIRNFNFYGAGSTTTAQGIGNQNFKSATLENVSFSGFKYGLYVNGGGIFYSTIKNCHFTDCEQGVRLNASLVNGTTFDDCRFDSCDYGMFTSYAGSPITLDGCWFEGCTSYGVYVADATVVNINNCYFENNGTQDVSMSSDGSYTTTLNVIGSNFEERTDGQSILVNGISFLNVVGSRVLANDGSECIAIATTDPYGIVSGCQFPSTIASPIRTSGAENLEILGINKNYAFRIKNMTTAQKNALVDSVAGHLVFDTTLSKLCVYSGSAWQTITSV